MLHINYSFQACLSQNEVNALNHFMLQALDKLYDVLI